MSRYSISLWIVGTSTGIAAPLPSVLYPCTHSIKNPMTHAQRIAALPRTRDNFHQDSYLETWIQSWKLFRKFVTFSVWKLFVEIAPVKNDFATQRPKRKPALTDTITNHSMWRHCVFVHAAHVVLARVCLLPIRRIYRQYMQSLCVHDCYSRLGVSLNHDTLAVPCPVSSTSFLCNCVSDEPFDMRTPWYFFQTRFSRKARACTAKTANLSKRSQRHISNDTAISIKGIVVFEEIEFEKWGRVVRCKRMCEESGYHVVRSLSLCNVPRSVKKRENQFYRVFSSTNCCS